MQNLAGHPQSTEIASAELHTAGIEAIPSPPVGEPRAEVAGRLRGWTFQRAWYYWIAKGRMPEKQALELNERFGREIRVAGFAGGTDVESWLEYVAPSGKLYAEREKELSPRLEALLVKNGYEVVDAYPDDALRVISSYHVDSARGLLTLANAIRALPADLRLVAIP